MLWFMIDFAKVVVIVVDVAFVVVVRLLWMFSLFHIVCNVSWFSLRRSSVCLLSFLVARLLFRVVCARLLVLIVRSLLSWLPVLVVTFSMLSL